MPVAAAAMVYTGATSLGIIGTAAAATGWAAVAAGAMLVGGSVSLLGTVTGDKNLERDGMIMGGIGSLGYGALTMAGYSGTAAANTAAQTSSVQAAGTPATAGAEGFVGAGGAAEGSLTAPGAVATPTPDIIKAIEDSNSKFTAAMEKMQQQNLIAQTVGGAGQAYSGYQQSKTEEGLINRKMDEEKAIRDRAYANANNLEGITLPSPSLPNFGKLYRDKLTKTPSTA